MHPLSPRRAHAGSRDSSESPLPEYHLRKVLYASWTMDIIMSIEHWTYQASNTGTWPDRLGLVREYCPVAVLRAFGAGEATVLGRERVLKALNFRVSGTTARSTRDLVDHDTPYRSHSTKTPIIKMHDRHVGLMVRMLELWETRSCNQQLVKVQAGVTIYLY